ncbi:hypothetical protein SAMN04487948_1163 [Halogranum amylolyticum]|uniref:Uncharacterized protein n=1 Tax=Halogranum amylolyticum TaxID=660520 RepID=A0A1H8VDS4_9EURY|nr:hypothetical protein [Halogranum amylolyticum]SEP13565.1 hypothetical protein SAMN04487948_1163 [Halogranum amylolyticum]
MVNIIYITAPLALVLLYGLSTFTAFPFWAIMAAVIVVGLVIPIAVNEMGSANET